MFTPGIATCGTVSPEGPVSPSYRAALVLEIWLLLGLIE